MESWHFDDYMYVIWQYFLKKVHIVDVAEEMGIYFGEILFYEEMMHEISSAEQATGFFGDLLLETTEKND